MRLFFFICVSVMRIANCFSGGVFLALAFGHLLPHSIGQFSEVLVNKHYAATLASVICAAGYLLVIYLKKNKIKEINHSLSCSIKTILAILMYPFKPAFIYM